MRVYEAKIVYSLLSLGEDVILNTPEKVADYLESAYAENPLQEAMMVIMLDRKNHPLARHLVSTGTLTSSLCHPREIFKAAILASAAAIIVSHNHPSSGDPAPSSADFNVTRMLKEAAKVIGIDLLDHVIVGDKHADPVGVGHYSFRQSGFL